LAFDDESAKGREGLLGSLEKKKSSASSRGIASGPRDPLMIFGEGDPNALGAYAL